MEYAGFWRRAAAMSLDGVLLGVIQAVVNIILIAMIGATSVAGGEPGDAEAGDRISFGKASGRYFGKIVSAILLMIGYPMAAFTKRKQALHDIMAGCLVIRKPKSA